MTDSMNCGPTNSVMSDIGNTTACKNLSKRQRGFIAIVLGILFISPDALLVRYAEEEQEGEGCVVFYKYVFKLVAVTIGVVTYFGGPLKYIAEAKAAGWHFFAAAFFEGICQALFTLALLHTTAANCTILFNANPLWCGLIAAVAYMEFPPMHTSFAIVAGFACIVVVFIGAQSESSPERESVFGNLLAVGAGLSAAAFLNVVRHAGKLLPRVMLLSATPLGSVVAVLVGLIATEGHIGAICMPKSGVFGWIYTLISGVVVMPLSIASFTYGAKYLLASEAALLMLTTVALGPMYVWMAFGEFPGELALLGGGLLLVVLISHGITGLVMARHAKQVKRKCSDQSLDSSTCGTPATVEECSKSEVVGHIGNDSEDQTLSLHDSRF